MGFASLSPSHAAAADTIGSEKPEPPSKQRLRGPLGNARLLWRLRALVHARRGLLGYSDDLWLAGVARLGVCGGVGREPELAVLLVRRRGGGRLGRNQLGFRTGVQDLRARWWLIARHAGVLEHGRLHHPVSTYRKYRHQAQDDGEGRRERHFGIGS